MSLITPQKIAVITPTFALSGVPLAQCRLARALSEEHHQVDLVIGNNPKNLQLPYIDNVKVKVLNKSRVFFMVTPLLKLFLFDRPNIIFTAEDHLNTIILLCALITKSNAIICTSSRVTPYDTYSDKFLTKRWVLKIIAKLVSFRANLQSCVSMEMVEQYKTIFPNSNHVPIYNIVVDNYSFLLSKQKPNHPWLIEKNYPVIIAAGMLEPWKGFDILLRAFAKSLTSTQAKLIILGDGSLRLSLLKLADQLNISKSFDLPGYQTNPLSFFSRSDVFVLSSRVEGMPNVLIESMLCGCTPVATDCPTGPKEVLCNEKFGYLCPVDNFSVMSDKIKQALSRPVPKSLLLEGTRKFTKEHVLTSYSKLLSTPLINI